VKQTNQLTTRGTSDRWRLEGCAESGFSGAVVIPALAESANLPHTLASLACSPGELLARFLIVVVVNHRLDASQEDQADNRETLRWLATAGEHYPALKLAWVDAASPGNELPLKGGGVGLARKIGCDLALARLHGSGNDSLLICLDADTTVRPDYLTAITAHFQQQRAGAASLPYIHRPAADPAGQAAIIRYELFLRAYVFGLELAGSPYAFHSVGSAMACTAAAYGKIGGMNCRTAGEDFYFLQQMARTVGVAPLSGTVVYPSPRSSHRVPFGTGRTVSRLLAEGDSSFQFYDPRCFMLLKCWLEIVRDNPAATSESVLQLARHCSPVLGEYLELNNFPEVWEKLQRHNPQALRFQTAFHGWFDGLKTMKLIHHLTDRLYPRQEPQLALPPLLAAGGVEVTGDDSLTMLEQLRHLQLGNDYENTTPHNQYNGSKQ